MTLSNNLPPVPKYKPVELNTFEYGLSVAGNVPLFGIAASIFSIVYQTTWNICCTYLLKKIKSNSITNLTTKETLTEEEKTHLISLKEKVKSYAQCYLKAKQENWNSFIQLPFVSSAYVAYYLNQQITLHKHSLKSKIQLSKEETDSVKEKLTMQVNLTTEEINQVKELCKGNVKISEKETNDKKQELINKIVLTETEIESQKKTLLSKIVLTKEEELDQKKPLILGIKLSEKDIANQKVILLKDIKLSDDELKQRKEELKLEVKDGKGKK